jgi:hypothetical protein
MGLRDAIHNIFMLTAAGIKRYGLFDENIYPAFCEGEQGRPGATLVFGWLVGWLAVLRHAGRRATKEKGTTLRRLQHATHVYMHAEYLVSPSLCKIATTFVAAWVSCPLADLDMIQRGRVMDPPMRERQFMDVHAVHGKRADTAYYSGTGGRVCQEGTALLLQCRVGLLAAGQYKALADFPGQSPTCLACLHIHRLYLHPLYPQSNLQVVD